MRWIHQSTRLLQEALESTEYFPIEKADHGHHDLTTEKTSVAGFVFAF